MHIEAERIALPFAISAVLCSGIYPNLLFFLKDGRQDGRVCDCFSIDMSVWTA